MLIGPILCTLAEPVPNRTDAVHPRLFTETIYLPVRFLRFHRCILTALHPSGPCRWRGRCYLTLSHQLVTGGALLIIIQFYA